SEPAPVPVTFSVKLWGGALVTTSVRVEVLPVETVAGENVAVTPDGNPLALSFTLSPALPFTETCTVPSSTVPSSGVIVSDVAPSDIENGAASLVPLSWHTVTCGEAAAAPRTWPAFGTPSVQPP